MIRYSPNQTVNAKIHKLLKLGVPPIPVAPKLDPKHPDGHRVDSPEYRYRSDKPEFVSCNGERVQVSGDYCKFITTAVGSEMAPVRGEFVRLDSNFSPTPLFTGKNPSFLGWDGKHRKLNHGQFQNRMPTDQEIKKWFANPNTGVGTLGGHNGIVWVDFDAKNYPTQEDCDRDVQALLDRIGKPTLTEKTGSGGYRVAVVPTVKPTFTNFSSEPGGKHLGEALFAGRYTVLAPSKHPNGNYYKEICDADPVEVDSLEAIGLYPSKDEAQSQQRAEKKVRKGSGDHRVTQQTFSDPVDNPWDIRNFAQFFEGYSERNGWGYAKCPAHNGTSLTSFRVRLDTGEFKAWCGCNTKSVYEAAKKVAEVFGYKFPENCDRARPETEHPEHGKTIDRENWLKKFGWQKLEALLKKCKSKKRSPWGFGKPQAEQQPETEPQSNSSQQVIEYQPGERLKTWEQYLNAGRKYILDISGTGTGKSHDAGLISPEKIGVNRVIYVSNDHRNPTTDTLKDWDDLEARHEGLVRDENGKIRRREGWDDRREHWEGKNCSRTGTIAALRNKYVEGADTSDLVCKTCPNFDGCRSGNVYGYLNQRAQTLKESNKFRAHPQSLPPADPSSSDQEPFNYAATEKDGGSLLIWEEAGESLNYQRNIEANARDASDAIAVLVEAQSWPIAAGEIVPDFSAALSILGKLRSLLSGDVKQPRFGWGIQDLTSILGEIPTDLDIEAIKTALAEDSQVRKILDPYQDEHGVSLGDLPGGAKRKLTERDSELAEKVANLIKQQWLVNFLEILKGDRLGYLTLSWGKLNITVADRKAPDIAHAAEGNIFQDATLTREKLALMLNIDPDEILVTKQAEEVGAEVEIIQVTELGKLTQQRGKRQIKGVAAVIAQLKEQEPNTKNIDFKKFCEPGFLAWWRDSRGSNDAQYCTQLIITGAPVKNLAALAAEFTLLYKRVPLEGVVDFTRQVRSVDACVFEFTSRESADAEFREFVWRDTQASILQAIGRLRANRRPGEKLKIYFLGDYALDFPVQFTRAVDIAPEAGTPWQQLVQQALKAKEAGCRTITEVAAFIGKSIGTISEAVKRAGFKWRDFYTKLTNSVLLENPFNSKTEILPEAELEAENFFVENFHLVAPEELIPEIALIVKSGGWKSWQRILNRLPAKIHSQLLAQVAALMPESCREIWADDPI